MKKLFGVMFVALLTVGCIEGPVGPQGPKGEPGRDATSSGDIRLITIELSTQDIVETQKDAIVGIETSALPNGIVIYTGVLYQWRGSNGLNSLETVSFPDVLVDVGRNGAGEFIYASTGDNNKAYVLLREALTEYGGTIVKRTLMVVVRVPN